jgi:hypothetical protein
MQTFLRFKLMVNESVLFSYITQISKKVGTTAFTPCNNKYSCALKTKVQCPPKGWYPPITLNEVTSVNAVTLS